MVLALLAILATYVLSRIAASSGDNTQTTARLVAAAEALEAFASNAQRLPCPSDPTADTGLEIPTAVGAATCTFPEGTVPWRSIGLKREDAFDSWGRKISYRVYTDAGSLTQPRGVSMVECDEVEPTAGATAPGGLCVSDPDPYKRTTTPANFFAGKGRTLDDNGVARADVAYVLVSHGATGLGGYTVSGARLDMPAGDERNNTRETGPFTIKAHSDVDVAATSGQHFDDLLAYRTLPELVRRINLAARDWPETGTTSVVFSQGNVSAAAGAPVAPGAGVGQSTLDFAGAQVSGRGPGAALAEISLDVGSADATTGIGVATGGSYLIESSANEFVRVDFTAPGTKFAVTLNDFGYYGFLFYEFVEFRFYLSEIQIGSPIVAFGCNLDGGLASYTLDIGQAFNRVEIVPLPALNIFGGSGITALLVSEVKACAVTEAVCRTSLDAPANRCV